MNYEDWAQQLDERVNSPAGRARLAKQAAQNQQNRQVKTDKVEKNQQERARAVAAAKAVEAKVRRDSGQDNQRVKPAAGNPRTRPTTPTPTPKAEPKAATKIVDTFRNNPAKTPDDNVAGAAERLKKSKDDNNFKRVMQNMRNKKRMDKISDIKSSRRKAEREKSELAAANKKPGFGSGVKSSLGGDVFHRGQDAESIKKKKEARNKLGRSVGDFMKKAPGRALGAAKNLVGQNTSNTGGTTNSQDLAGPKTGVYNG